MRLLLEILAAMFGQKAGAGSPPQDPAEAAWREFESEWDWDAPTPRELFVAGYRARQSAERGGD